jgi:hypothetical protein
VHGTGNLWGLRLARVTHEVFGNGGNNIQIYPNIMMIHLYADRGTAAA